MFSASSFLFLIILFLILSSTLFCSAIPIGHYDGEWKLLEVSDNSKSSMVNEMISRFFPQLLNDENNNFFNNHILKYHPSSYSNTKSIRRMLPGGSSSSIDDDDDDIDTNNINNNTTTARGVFRLHSVFNLTSQTISTTMSWFKSHGKLGVLGSTTWSCPKSQLRHIKPHRKLGVLTLQHDHAQKASCATLNPIENWAF